MRRWSPTRTLRPSLASKVDTAPALVSAEMVTGSLESGTVPYTAADPSHEANEK